MTNKSKCCTCEFEWETGQSGDHSCSAVLQERLNNVNTLTLTSSEATWLKELVQHPVRGEPPDAEDRQDTTMRIRFWELLKGNRTAEAEKTRVEVAELFQKLIANLKEKETLINKRTNILSKLFKF